MCKGHVFQSSFSSIIKWHAIANGGLIAAAYVWTSRRRLHVTWIGLVKTSMVRRNLPKMSLGFQSILKEYTETCQVCDDGGFKICA